MGLIKLNHSVVNVEPKGNSGFQVEVEDLKSMDRETKSFDTVIVCNGHYSQPNVPNLPGIENFKGKILHSHDYRKSEDFKDLTVACIGAGFSGQDIVLELVPVAKRVILSYHSNPITWKLPGNFEQVPEVLCILEDGSLSCKNGQIITADVIIYCTGYLFDLPFLDASCGVTTDHEKMMVQPIYKHMIHRDFPDSMFFIGFPFTPFHFIWQIFSASS